MGDFDFVLHRSAPLRLVTAVLGLATASVALGGAGCTQQAGDIHQAVNPINCKLDADCPPATICQAGTCSPGCNANHLDCGDAGVCNLGMGQCHPCQANADCKNPNKPLCDGNGECVACQVNLDKCPPGQYCQDQGGGLTSCVVGCKADGDCPRAMGACCQHACTDTTTDKANCGACGKACALPNAVAACQAAACVVQTCNAGFADCNHVAADGCEVALGNDAANCGSCGNACRPPNAMGVCQAGACALGVCNPGFADCNHVAADGCEVEVNADVASCGACGNVCMLANAVPACRLGACAVGMCNPGFADCNQVAADGCEAALRQDVANCGSCGSVCALPHAVQQCVGGTCHIGACVRGFLDCNGILGDGCEQDVATDPAHCGSCQTDCRRLPEVNAVGCAAGVCQITTCQGGWADCNHMPGDGCEVHIAADPANCGACGMPCAKGANGTATCTVSTCGLACNANFADCNHDLRDGCEVSLLSDKANCGACGKACPGNQACLQGHCGLKPPDWRLQSPMSSPDARSEHGLVFDKARGVAVLFGGFPFPSTHLFNDTWEWNGVNWTQVMTKHAPIKRSRHGMVYDESRKVTVVFGGLTDTGNVMNPYPDANDTWEYDGVDWTQVKTLDAPSARDSAAMTYDSNRKVTVLFGGSGNAIEADTWEYNGVDWKQILPKQSPPARFSASLAFDSGRKVAVLLGGETSIQNQLGDTWEWDGVNWTQKTPMVPLPARSQSAVTFYPDFSATLVFSGFGEMSDVQAGETWEWGGDNWLHDTPVDAPKTRLGARMTYDSTRGELVLFGGVRVPGAVGVAGGMKHADNETWVWGP